MYLSCSKARRHRSRWALAWWKRCSPQDRQPNYQSAAISERVSVLGVNETESLPKTPRIQRRFFRLPPRFVEARDLEETRDLEEARDLEDARLVRGFVRDFAAFDRPADRCVALLRERAAVLRDRLPDFVVNCRFAVLPALFALSAAFRRILVLARATRPPLAALPATAPATPPTIAPIGPATLPTAAPATAPAVVFGIGGISMFSDDWDDCSFC